MYAQGFPPTIITTSPSPNATSISHSSVVSKSSSQVTYRAPGRPSNAPLQPIGRGEQYWAARALTAETLLSANTMYQEKMRVMTQVGESKHSVSQSCG